MRTILIVDDEWSIVESLVDILGDEGYRVISARNGQEGLERLDKERPDLVLLDVMMPVLDGRAMLARLRDDPRYEQLPVLLMSAAPSVLHSEHLAYQGFVKKPFTIDEIVTTIASTLERAPSQHDASV